MNCHHKWFFFVTNRGLMTQSCGKYRCSVNEDICSSCPHREGETPKLPADIDLRYPKRSDEEIRAIYEICKVCPHFNPGTKICNKMRAEFHPTDIVAQHPSNHCPIELW